ncbi:hypothetical protein BDN72DRAFT_884027 [Pluteus cervinus]|uniref:Uncharacterized protein n=1 Tax=Pluteus cervinus TaxID=181527 RepID=A0ACD3A2Y7_9AGAR|nr:hypothetical protein BDN72DRAFT_884027 [Pluteus cervinus]
MWTEWGVDSAWWGGGGGSEGYREPTSEHQVAGVLSIDLLTSKTPRDRLEGSSNELVVGCFTIDWAASKPPERGPALLDINQSRTPKITSHQDYCSVQTVRETSGGTKEEIKHSRKTCQTSEKCSKEDVEDGLFEGKGDAESRDGTPIVHSNSRGRKRVRISEGENGDSDNLAKVEEEDKGHVGGLDDDDEGDTPQPSTSKGSSKNSNSDLVKRITTLEWRLLQPSSNVVLKLATTSNCSKEWLP